MAEDERILLESLFYKGYEYQEILQILRTQHGIELSLSTLKRKLKDYNLSRNKVEFDRIELREIIVQIMYGPGCFHGYRSIWHTLQRKGMRVSRSAVKEIVQELDPEGVKERKAHRMCRMEYIYVQARIMFGILMGTTN